MMTLNSFTDEQIKTLMRPSIKSKNGNTADMREEIIEIMFNSPSFRKNVSRTHPFRQELHEAVRSQMRPMVADGGRTKRWRFGRPRKRKATISISI